MLEALKWLLGVWMTVVVIAAFFYAPTAQNLGQMSG